MTIGHHEKNITAMSNFEDMNKILDSVRSIFDNIPDQIYSIYDTNKSLNSVRLIFDDTPDQIYSPFTHRTRRGKIIHKNFFPNLGEIGEDGIGYRQYGRRQLTPSTSQE